VTIRIVIADDHAMVRAGICALVDRIAGVEVVGEAGNGREAVALVAERRPDLALINISMPELNGLETLIRIRSAHPHTRVVILSLHADEEYVRRALSHGASGYLVKSADATELELAIRAASRGDVWLSPSVSTAIVKALVQREPVGDPFELLTSRQREVLQLVAEGLTSKDIADRLGLSLKTIESHRAQLMKRLGVSNVPGLVRSAIRLGLVSAGLDNFSDRSRGSP
jgi:DNA-binding NarL/FixJ family response regulator